MKTDRHQCPICGETLCEAEAALNRTWSNVVFTGFGSSQLQIRPPKGEWKPFMKPGISTKALYCPDCGALTLAPSLPAHRRELGLEPKLGLEP